MSRPKQHVSWADDKQSGVEGFLALGGQKRSQPAPPPPARAPIVAEGFDDRAPFARNQDLHPKASALRTGNPPSSSPVSKNAAGTMRLGKKTFSIISTLQAPRTEEEGMSQGVYHVHDSEKQSLVVKRLSMATPAKTSRTKAEVSVLLRIRDTVKVHENINQIKEIFWSRSNPTADLILEYCDDGSLADGIDFMRAHKTHINEDLVFHLMYGIAKGLAMIHHGIPDHTDHSTKIKGWNTMCHLDIKPANILLTKQQLPGREHMRHPRVVLADFGCSITKDDIQSGRESKIVQEHGTPGWFPPENGNPEASRYGKPTDIWQCGGVIQAMCLLLFQPDMDRLKLPCGKNYSAALNCLVAACLSPEFQKRPTAVGLCDEVRAVMVAKRYQV